MGAKRAIASADAEGTTFGALQNAPGALTQHDAAYDTTFAYRGNPTSTWKLGGATMSYAYNIGGLPYKMQDGDGLTVSTAQDSSTAYSLP